MEGLVCAVKRFFEGFARGVESPLALQIWHGGGDGGPGSLGRDGFGRLTLGCGFLTLVGGWIRVCGGCARVSGGSVTVGVGI